MIQVEERKCLRTDKIQYAEECTKESRSFVRLVKAVTRRNYTAEKKIRIVLGMFRREVTVNELCRREGIKPHSFSMGTEVLVEASKQRQYRHSVRASTQREVNRT